MTSSGQLHEVSMKIGELLANVQQLAESNHGAHQDRAAIQKKLDQVVMDVNQLKSDVADMKPSVQRYNADRNRLMGGVAVIGSLFGAASSFALTYFKKAWNT